MSMLRAPTQRTMTKGEREVEVLSLTQELSDESVEEDHVRPAVMGGKPCIRGMRVTVGMIMGLLAAGRTEQEILAAYPYLEIEDLREALAYAAWRVEEAEVPLAGP